LGYRLIPILKDVTPMSNNMTFACNDRKGTDVGWSGHWPDRRVQERSTSQQHRPTRPHVRIRVEYQAWRLVRSHGRVAFLCLMWAAAGLTLGQTGCKKCTEPPKPPYQTEHVRHVRSVTGATETHGSDHRRDVARYGQVLVQRLPFDMTVAVQPFGYAFYSTKASDVMLFAGAFAAAKPSAASTCAPHWRIDLTGPNSAKTAFVNRTCGLLRIDGRDYHWSASLADKLDPYLRKTRSKPTHRLIRLRVASQLTPSAVLKLLRARVATTMVPGGKVGRLPYVEMSVDLHRSQPADLTRLDETAGALRRQATAILTRYAQALVDSRPEAVRYEGPRPLGERFGRVMEVRFGMTVYFKYGTDELTMRYLCSGLDLHMDQVVVPASYRLDILVPRTTSLRKVRDMIKSISIKPPLDLWRKRPSKTERH